MKQALVLFAIGMLCLAGCASEGKYEQKLQGAHDALEADFPELAEHKLREAKELGADREVSVTSQAELLEGELLLRQGKLVEARKVSERILTAADPGSCRRGQAQEILAKVAIRDGKFVVAKTHLKEAQQNYSNPNDRQRVEDLKRLTDGLECLAAGKAKQAQKYWDQIEDPSLRFSIREITVEHPVSSSE